MPDKTYNGWTNYATWRINLEVFDGMDAEEMDCFTRYETPNQSDVAEYLEQYANDIIFTDCADNELVADYARAFISDVNWYEIAQHFIDEWQELMNEEERERDEESCE